MFIRAMTSTFGTGELGRPASIGGKGGATSLFSGSKDVVSLGNRPEITAGLYSANPSFKIMGRVELVSHEQDASDEAAGFGDKPFLL